ncbi:MAG: SiaB family protein kinase [Burkholderiales bacterium]|nr:SiaB family protein kinase [Burkholderiales bacterium]
MKVDDFFSYHEEITEKGIFLTFSGILTHDFLIKLGTTLKSSMSLYNVDSNIVLKIFALVVEQSQNIIFYSAERLPVSSPNNEKMGIGTITVGLQGQHFFVLCGNRIANENVEKLRNKLVPIQKMGKDELKQYYKEQRRMDPDESSKGAGLGLIEMARKASQPIEFAFRKLDEGYSFFTLKTVI